MTRILMSAYSALSGADYINLEMDDHFDHRIRKFKAIQANNRQIDGFTINGEDGKTIYDLMTAFRRYIPKDVKYYKGLGELRNCNMRHDPHSDVGILSTSRQNHTQLLEDGKTIYDLMTAFRRYIPKDVKYYKGLGELTPKEMRELCMSALYIRSAGSQ